MIKYSFSLFFLSCILSLTIKAQHPDSLGVSQMPQDIWTEFRISVHNEIQSQIAGKKGYIEVECYINENRKIFISPIPSIENDPKALDNAIAIIQKAVEKYLVQLPKVPFREVWIISSTE